MPQWMPTSSSASSSRTICARRSTADELELAYQPVFSADGERVVGVEALARWNHPAARTPSPPVEFIPIAEQSGLDHAARRMGVAPRLPRRGGLAGLALPSTSRRCSSAGPTSSEMVAAHPERDRLRRRRGSSSKSPNRPCSGNVEGAETAMRRPQGARRAPRARRFRHRLFEPALSAPLSRSTSSRSTAASSATSRAPRKRRRSCTPSSASAAASA